MCGIVGYLNLNGKALDPDQKLIKNMCKSITHRGPDEEGMMIVGPAALGMTRLAIIDLVSGQQPIPNEDKTIWIVFNGEIYNYQDNQKHLIERGHKLATQSDTETIVHLYEEYGVDCLNFLEGMFSFAIWDTTKERLFIARDRMGEKPLHWGIFDGQLLFASELKGILTHPSSKRELEPVALQKYLALEYVPAPNSIFKGINKLMPGHFMLVEHGEVKIAPYWQPEISVTTLSEGDAKDKLVTLLDESIKRRLISDVPLGIFLSGGIDSSTIAALASRHSSKPLRTFSVGFADASFDESEHAQAVATYLGTEHEVITFQPDLALQTMQELWEVLDEPMADASIIPTFFLSKMTKRSVTVALAGEGGDELFGGYPTYQAHKLAGIWNTLPAVLRQHVLEPTINNLPVSHNNLSFDYKVKRFISAASESPRSRHLQWMGAFPVKDHAQLINAELRTGGVGTIWQTGEDLLNNLEVRSFGSVRRKSDLLDSIMRLDLGTYLPDDLLVKSDRASMAASLEVRLPFLAHPLVEFALSLPSQYKVRGATTKYLLKKAAAPYLPSRTINRPKKGFGIPVAKWLNNDFKPLLDEYLCQSFVDKQGVFQWPYINQLRTEHERGHKDRRKELWTLLMFQWWYNKFFVEKIGT
ncbi:MAG: asparagine synthase (glutamine-hydrolyzing) [Cyanobacteria bacterium SZAS-4]|nr:asparagine synthase (glutamine-hydrolyzing) [Cyanobacteria bacterium SZAS-4]